MPFWEKWRNEFDDKMPIYRQIILQFCRALARRDIKPGDRIPSIRELSALLKVNTNTIQRVYQEMEREGMITSKRGTGYFFTEDENMTKRIRHTLALDSLQRFVVEMRSLGCTNKEISNELSTYMKGENQHGNDC